MSYFASNKVRVFPSSYRMVNASGKFTSERNLTNMIKALSNVDSFVVDWSGGNSATGNIKVVVDGYYFEIDGITFPDREQYLTINVKSDYLVNYSDDRTVLDVGTNFTGINLGDSDESGNGKTSLLVWDGSKIVNKGYIMELLDEDGNWIKLNEFIKNGKIDASKIDISTLINVIASIVVDKSKTLVDNNGNPYTVGSYTNPIWFKNGIPVKALNITASTSGPSGSGNNGDLWIVYK